MKSFQIRSYFWSCGVISGPCFPVFEPEITPYLDTFHAVLTVKIKQTK